MPVVPELTGLAQLPLNNYFKLYAAPLIEVPMHHP
jgi:hypothetical protein